MALKFGRNILRWCQSCQLPILRTKQCFVCEEKTVEIKATPPFEFRPGFEIELNFIRTLCDEFFGSGTGLRLIPKNGLVLINDIPGIDRFEEIFVEGECVAALVYEIGQGHKLVIKIEGARRIAAVMSRNFVILEEDAKPFILKKASMLRPGVIAFDPELRKGRDVVVMDSERQVVSVGPAIMNGTEIAASEKGVVAKTRNVTKEMVPSFPLELLEPEPVSWEDAAAANTGPLQRLEEEAVTFIKNMVADHPELPVSISFSGGKDSLATLLLVRGAGLKPVVVFINTDLEFPETVDYVHRLVESYELELLEAKTAGVFWKAFQDFGPPAKDYRWCCKTQKLGPVSTLFKEHYPQGVLSFIGQRKFESREREKKGRVWKNPWVPLQLGASPIQNWTSMEIWLYTFQEKAEINPWYTRGLARIGCWLCPASDQGDVDFMERFYQEGLEQLETALRAYAGKKGFSEDWVKFGLWRWKRAPQFCKDDERLMKAIRRETSGTPEPGDEPWFKLKLLDEGISVVPGGFVLKARFNRVVDLFDVHNLLSMLGHVREQEEGLEISRNENLLVLGADGLVEAKGAKPKELKGLLETMRKLVIKAKSCLFCGVCLSACPPGALSFQDGRLVLDEEACLNCLKCVSPCPAVDYKGRD